MNGTNIEIKMRRWRLIHCFLWRKYKFTEQKRRGRWSSLDEWMNVSMSTTMKMPTDCVTHTKQGIIYVAICRASSLLLPLSPLLLPLFSSSFFSASAFLLRHLRSSAFSSSLFLSSSFLSFAFSPLSPLQLLPLFSTLFNLSFILLSMVSDQQYAANAAIFLYFLIFPLLSSRFVVVLAWVDGVW